MAGDWIKFEAVTPDKCEVHQMADALAIDPDAVVGKLLRVWIWANQQTVDGNAPSVTKSLIDRITHVSGFADAMIAVAWLDDSAGTISFRNFDRHNGNTAKTRALSQTRTKKHRSTSQTCNADTVTKPLQQRDQRREEKSSLSGSAKLPDPGECVIPENCNTPLVLEAAARWFAYLRLEAPDKIPPDGSPQLEAFWREVSRTGPETFPKTVDVCIRNNWKNLRELETPKHDRKTKHRQRVDDALTREREKIERVFETFVP